MQPNNGNNGRGRPAGSFGSSFLRAYMRRQNRENAEEAEDGAQQQQQSQNQRGRPRRGPSFQANNHINGNGDGNQALHGGVAVSLDLWNASHASPLQLMLLKHAQDQSMRPANVEANNPAAQILGQGRRVVSSAKAAKPQHSPGDLRRTASAVIEGAGLLWSGLLVRLEELMNTGSWKGLFFLVSRRYDETPLHLRVADQDEPSSDRAPPAKPTKQVAKVMQSEMYLSALLQNAATQQCVEIKGKVPCHLQVLQTTRAQQIATCQQNMLNLVPNLDSVSRQFAGRYMHVATDRYSANLAAEADLKKKNQPFGLVHTTCNVHKVSSAEKSMSDVLKGQLSGMVSLSLCMSSPGALKELRQCLFEIFKEDLTLKVANPSCQAHRRGIYDLFLPVSDASDTHVSEYSGRKSSKQTSCARRQQRRAILDHYLNGDINSRTVTHHCQGIRDREVVLDEFKHYVVPALVPSTLPVLNRAKWLGCEESFRWVGLLLAHHNLLARLMERWKGGVQGLTAADSKMDGPTPGAFDLAGSRHERWAQAAASASAASASFGLDLDGDGMDGAPRNPAFDMVEPDEGCFDDPFAPETVSDPITGDLDWAECNRANVRKALAWLESNPADVTIMMTIAWEPILQLMRDTIFLGSEEWERQEDAKVAAGEQRSYKVLELFTQSNLNKFHRKLNKLFHRPCDAMPASAHVCHMRSLMFRLLSRSGAAVHQVYGAELKGAPYCLFGALWGILTPLQELPECQRDELTQWFCERYSWEELLEPEAQNILHTLAASMQFDIVGIEVRHASCRRLKAVKSCMTWALGIEDLGSEFVCREQVIQQQHFQRATGTGCMAQSQARNGQGRAPRKSKGGPWRAFLHHRYANKFLSRERLREASQTYQAMKAANGEEWQFYKNLGLLATLSGRRGLKPLKQKRKKKASKHRLAHRSVSRLLLEQKLLALSQEAASELEEAKAKEAKQDALVQKSSEAVHAGFNETHGLQLPSLAAPLVEAVGEGDAGASSSQFVGSTGSRVAPVTCRYYPPTDVLATDPWF